MAISNRFEILNLIGVEEDDNNMETKLIKLQEKAAKYKKIPNSFYMLLQKIMNLRCGGHCAKIESKTPLGDWVDKGPPGSRLILKFQSNLSI